MKIGSIAFSLMVLPLGSLALPTHFDQGRLQHFYTPDTTFEALTGQSISQLSDTDPKPTMSQSELLINAKKLLSARLNVSEDDLLVKTSFQDAHNGVFHLYVMQSVDGIPISNSPASISTDAAGNLITFSNAWAKVSSQDRKRLLKRGEELTASQAVVSFGHLIGKDIVLSRLTEKVIAPDTIEVRGANLTTIGYITAKHRFFKTKDSLLRTWALQVQLKRNWYNAFISVTDGSLVGSFDWVSAAMVPENVSKEETAITGFVAENAHRFNNASLWKRQNSKLDVKYSLFPYDPSRKGLIVADISDPIASPRGWHVVGNEIEKTTSGNNVIAQENNANLDDIANNFRPNLDDMNFVFQVNDINEEPKDYVSASVTNAFVISNIFHDVMYHYGFTPAAGNFQKESFGKGRPGGDNDPVIVNVQDGSSANNANFASGPDGTSGIMKLSLFTKTSPKRDAALDLAVVIHELTHGLTNRLTGGAGNGNCMTAVLTRGLGEGWSDIVALIFRMSPTDTRNDPQLIAEYLTGNSKKGIRSYPYSTDRQVNPLMYSSVRGRDSEVHKIGEVWANVLFEVYWNMVDAHGFSTNLKKDVKSDKGNTMFLQLLVDGMKLQPCNPNFVQARDAIIKADQINNQGTNVCILMKGFAKRGLGVNARNFIDDFTLPAGCM